MSTVIVVSYTGEEWADVISYRDIGDAIAGEYSVYPRVVKLPRCEVSKSAARCKRPSPNEVEIEWLDNETNRKNEIELGRLYLTWDDSNDVLFAAPSTAYWVKAGCVEKQYANVTLIKGQFKE